MALSITQIDPLIITEGDLVSSQIRVTVRSTNAGDSATLQINGLDSTTRFVPSSVVVQPSSTLDQTFVFNLINDNLRQSDRTYQFSLSALPNLLLSTPLVPVNTVVQASLVSTTILVRDDDTPPSPPPTSPTGLLTFSPTNVYTVDEGAGFIRVELRYTGGGATGLQGFTVRTQNGTAKFEADNSNDPRFGDYGFNNAEFERVFSFTTTGSTTAGTTAVGLTTAQTFTVTIPINDDRELEGNETFFLSLDSVVGASTGNDSVAITILDNDVQSFSPFLEIPPTPRVGTPDADLLDLTDNADIQFANQGNDTISGRGGNDTLYGGADQDLIDGGAGNDVLFGNRGDDTLTGGSGNDFLYGGQGDDSMTGGSGNDTLSGDLGIDFLTGGLGSDVFILRSSSGFDTVTDFEPGTDLFALAGGVRFQDISIQPAGQDTVISLTRTTEVLSRVLNTSAGSLGAGNFIEIPKPFV